MKQSEKNKEQGGSMLGVHVGLNPILIKEYSDSFELIVVQTKAADKDIMIMTWYGPQESWKDHERLPFFTALEEEIASAEYEGKSVIIAMDANSKLGPNHIPGDPHQISINGKVLEGIVERHGLVVVNGLLEKRKGTITREKNTVNGTEKSIIDLVLISSDLLNHIEHVHVDDERVHVLTKNLKTKTGIHYMESDHNIINTRLNIKWNSKKAKVMEVFNYKDVKSLGMFKAETTNTDCLSKIIDLDKPIDVVAKKFMKRLSGVIHKCFNKVKIVDKEDKRLQKLYNTRRVLRNKSDDESVLKLEEVEKELSEKYADIMCKKIMGEIKDVGDSEDGGYSAGRLWKLKKKLSPKHTEPPTAMLNSKGKLLTNDEDIKKEAVNHYTNVFKSKDMKAGLEDIKNGREELCRARLKKAKETKSPPWSVDDVKCVLKHLKIGKSKDPYDIPNELFRLDNAGDDLILAITKLMNRIKKEQIFPKLMNTCNVTNLYKK